MMKTKRSHTSGRVPLDGRLAAYLAATGAAGSALATDASAAVVGDLSVQPFGINEEVNIDFNGDGQVDFQIDHDRVDLGGGNVVDYLQLDKNDVSSALTPLPIDNSATFPLNGTVANDTGESAYVTPTGTLGDYPAALTFGTPIGPGSSFDFQEGTNFDNSGDTIRANRLIDEDATQVDQVLGGLTAAQVVVPTNGPNFLGLGGQTRYLGVKMDLNDNNQITYGWIGVRITNEADATGEVVGWAYQTNGGAIAAGVPEPGSIAMALFGGAALVGSLLWRRIVR